MSLLSAPSLSDLTAGVWNVDSTHSTIGFVARHLMVSKVRGSFGTFTGTVTVADDPLASKVEASAETASITTGDDTRDNHLKSADFFDAANHPKLTYKSTSFKKTGDDEFLMTGNMTIRGTTRPLEMKVEFGGIMVDPYGNTKAGFELSGKLNRKEFGLHWNAITEAGGMVVADDVKLALNVELAKVQ